MCATVSTLLATGLASVPKPASWVLRVSFRREPIDPQSVQAAGLPAVRQASHQLHRAAQCLRDSLGDSARRYPAATSKEVTLWGDRSRAPTNSFPGMTTCNCDYVPDASTVNRSTKNRH